LITIYEKAIVIFFNVNFNNWWKI